MSAHAISPSIGTQLHGRYRAVRAATERLTEHLSEADCVVQSMTDASPVKWHLAHTTWFFETFILEKAVPDYQPVNPAFRFLFNSYYNGIGDKHPRPERGLITRPDLAQVRSYRAQIDERIGQAWLHGHLSSPQLLSLLEIGLNHEQQHQELILTDFKHLLSKNPLQPTYRAHWPLVPVAQRREQWLHYDGGLVQIGHRGDDFAFDNESPAHRVFLEPFELAAYPATNGEYLAFIDDGGYQRPELWLSLGWDAVHARAWRAPLYWSQQDGQWRVFTLHGPMPLDPSAPVCHLSYFEADAFARWSNAVLPTEAQWEHAAQRALASAAHGNFADNNLLHPVAAQHERPLNAPAQLFGDVWEWTRSSYDAYPGFTPAPGLVGEYNGKFMAGQYVLRGGSCATPAGHVRASYRNFFPPDARWQFSGVRLTR
jgi:ergothioneine biosynthesis protein EgtB